MTPLTRDYPYLYLNSLREAKRYDEVPKWRESHKLNVACKDAIEEAIRNAEYTSQVAKENCYLCSENPESELSRYFGHKNLGIVNVNTFDVVELEINRYDHTGNQIMEATGCMTMGIVDIGGISVSCRTDPDRSLA